MKKEFIFFQQKATGIYQIAAYNSDFNSVEFDGFRKSAGLHTFTLSVTEWHEKTNAIDKRQNDEVLFHLDYIGKQLQDILNAKAGREVKVEKFANKLANDDKRTPAQVQKDETIVELGYIGDVLKKINDVENGKLEPEKQSKQSKRVRV